MWRRQTDAFPSSAPTENRNAQPIGPERSDRAHQPQTPILALATPLQLSEITNSNLTPAPLLELPYAAK